MRRMKRVIALLLATTLILGVASISYAEESYEHFSVKISNGTDSQMYGAIAYEDDVYFPAESYGDFSRYTYQDSEENIGYTLGKKIIIIDKETGEMSIPVLNYKGHIGEIIIEDGIVYVSASKLLPWLNVECNVNGGTMEIIPDALSFWEIAKELDEGSYKFDIIKEYGDSTTDVLGLSMMTVFDTLINIRWDRLIPADGTITGAGKNASLYDYECYVSALTEMATDDTLASEKMFAYIESAVSLNNGLSGIEESIGVDRELIEEGYKDILETVGDAGEGAEFVGDVITVWNDVRDALDTYDEITKYINVARMMKACELTAKTDSEYREYINWLAEQETDNVLLNAAADKVSLTLDKNTGALASYLMDMAGEVVDSIPGKVIESMKDGAAEDMLADAVSSGFFGSLDAYMFVAKIFYNTVIPVADGFEGMAKVSDNQAIQNYCWGLANQLAYEEMTEENLMHIRQSYLTALKASKMSYEAMQDTMDVKLFGEYVVFEAFNGEGLMDYKLDPIKEKIVELTMCAGTSLNDSVEGKEEYTAELLAAFKALVQEAKTVIIMEMLRPTLTYGLAESAFRHELKDVDQIVPVIIFDQIYYGGFGLPDELVDGSFNVSKEYCEKVARNYFGKDINWDLFTSEGSLASMKDSGSVAISVGEWGGPAPILRIDNIEWIGSESCKVSVTYALAYLDAYYSYIDEEANITYTFESSNISDYGFIITDINKTEIEPTYIDLYADILSWEDNAKGFAFCDFNKDDVPELLVTSGYSDYMNEWAMDNLSNGATVYYWDTEKWELHETNIFGNVMPLCYDEKNNYVYTQWIVGGGDSRITLCMIDNEFRMITEELLYDEGTTTFYDYDGIYDEAECKKISSYWTDQADPIVFTDIEDYPAWISGLGEEWYYPWR